MSKEENSDGAPQEGAGGGESSRKETDIYENRRTKKIIRLVTVMAYMFSVSFVAIVLSAYYLFLWEPPNPRLIRRPVQLSSEPEVQYLQGDKMTVQDDPNKPAQHTNATNVLFLDRIVDIEKPVNNYDHVKEHREKLNESLFLLPNSLIESWKNRINNPNSFVQDSSLENGTSNFFNYTSFEKGKTLNLTRKLIGRGTKDSSKITNRMFGNNGTFQILDSSTIFGNETNNDHFTNTRNYSESPQNIFPLNHNFTKNTVTNRNEDKNNVLSSFKSEAETFNKKSVKVETLQYPEIYLSNGRFIDTTMTIMAINDKEKFDIQNSREDRAYNINNIKQAINLNKQTTLDSSRNLELENRLKYPEQSNKLPGKLANIASKFKGK